MPSHCVALVSRVALDGGRPVRSRDVGARSPCSPSCTRVRAGIACATKRTVGRPRTHACSEVSGVSAQSPVPPPARTLSHYRRHFIGVPDDLLVRGRIGNGTSRRRAARCPHTSPKPRSRRSFIFLRVPTKSTALQRLSPSASHVSPPRNCTAHLHEGATMVVAQQVPPPCRPPLRCAGQSSRWRFTGASRPLGGGLSLTIRRRGYSRVEFTVLVLQKVNTSPGWFCLYMP